LDIIKNCQSVKLVYEIIEGKFKISKDNGIMIVDKKGNNILWEVAERLDGKRVRITIEEKDIIPCPCIYKSEICGYTGVLPTCDKTLEDCERHENSKRFIG